MQNSQEMILYQDSEWLVVNKPTGLATHAGQPGELGVVEWLALHLGLTTYVVSRLDRGTSGALLLALNPAAAARAQPIHEAGTTTKTYEFLSASDNNTPHWQCDDPLDGKSAHTIFTRVGSSRDGRWHHYRAEITSGRRHQIRRHARAAGVPILGDNEYGGAKFCRLCLHCTTVQWPEIDTAIGAPKPDTFAALLGETDTDPALTGCFDRRGHWLDTITNAFRVVHRDEVTGLPVAIDIYDAWFDAVWFDETRPPTPRLESVLDAIKSRYGCRGGVIRTHRRNPHQRQLVTNITVVGESPPPVFTVTEHGLRYEINLLTTQHTGLFLDQRDTRRRVALRSQAARVANLFAYTCSFSVVAAQHGAEVVFSIDTAKPGLNSGKRNFAANALDKSGQGKFIQQDARQWLARQIRRQDQPTGQSQALDIVICDPPVFAASKQGGHFSVAEDWPALSQQCAALLAPAGVAVFANNHRAGDHKFYRDTLAAAFSTVISLRPPLDFPVFPGQLHHVRTFWCTPDNTS